MSTPSYVLSLKIHTFDDEFVKIEDLLKEITDQDIEHSEYIVTFDDIFGDSLQKFTAWTKDHVIVLVKTAHGDYLLKNDRNFKEPT